MKSVTPKSIALCTFTAVTLAALMLAPSRAFASGISEINGTYTYVINLPTLSGDSLSPTFTFSTGPTAFGDPNGNLISAFATGSPIANGSYVDIAFTSGSTVPGGDPLVEAYVAFLDSGVGGSENGVAFAFLEPESFWATAGTNLSFANGGSDSAYGLLYEDPTPPNYSPNYWGDTNLGASYQYISGDAITSDPPCDTCSVTITFVPAASTPEPSSLWLLGSGLLGLAGMVRRKLGQNI